MSPHPHSLPHGAKTERRTAATLGEASNGAILGRRRPSSCQAGTMDRCWCGGRGNSGPSIPNKRAVGREARAQDCLVQVPDLLVSRDFGILPTGHFALTSEKGFTMLQINVTAQPTVLAGAKVFHCQRFRPISLFSRAVSHGSSLLSLQMERPRLTRAQPQHAIRVPRSRRPTKAQ